MFCAPRFLDLVSLLALVSPCPVSGNRRHYWSWGKETIGAMRDIPVILFGVGGVGRSLLRQILDLRDMHAVVYGLRLSVTAVCDRNGAVVTLGGALEDDLLREITALKESGGQLASHPLGGPQGDSYSIVDIAGRAGALVVDCTASDATLPGLLYALDRRYKIVLANKKPLTGAQDTYDLLVSGAMSGNSTLPIHQLRSARWEATVGAGLPVNAMLSRLMTSGDEVRRIAGALSGTLGYVMSGLQQGKALSEIVADAYRQGYTEPDPRDDLSGVDVARKALILGRGLGWRMEMADVEVESLYPASMNGLSVQEFLDELPALDDAFRKRVEAADAQGQVLRYAATVEDGRCSVGPVNVPKDSPLGRLTGTDNLVEFATRWYNPESPGDSGKGSRR